MVSCAFLAMLARCRKDHSLESSWLCVGKLWGQDGPALRSLTAGLLCGTPGCWGTDVTGVPLTGGPVQGDGMQRVGPLFQGPAHAPDLFPIPTAAPCPPAGCRDRNLPLAGEGLTGLHRAVRGGSAAGTTAPCQASNGSCARRGNLGLGVSLPYRGVCQVCGVSTAPDTRCSSGAAVGTQAWCQP